MLTTFPGSSTTVIGSLHGAPSSRFRIEFFANPDPSSSAYIQGQHYLGSIDITTDESGNKSFEAPSLARNPSERICATATLTCTNPDGSTLFLNTSGFSQEEPTVGLDVGQPLGLRPGCDVHGGLPPE